MLSQWWDTWKLLWLYRKHTSPNQPFPELDINFSEDGWKKLLLSSLQQHTEWDPMNFPSRLSPSYLWIKDVELFCKGPTSKCFRLCWACLLSSADTLWKQLTVHKQARPAEHSGSHYSSSTQEAEGRRILHRKTLTQTEPNLSVYESSNLYLGHLMLFI